MPPISAPRKRRRILRRILIITPLGLLLAACGVLQGCMNFGMKPAEVDAYYAKRGLPVPTSHTFATPQGHTVHYVEAEKRASAPLLVFVHGSPGEWTAWAGFLADPELRARTQIVAVDRLGYGGSEPGHVEPSLAAQAAAVAAVIENAGGGPAIVIGHSLGGPVVARLAMDRPDLVGGLVLVAPSIDPSLEFTHWYQIPASWWGLRRLVPRDLRVCNEEILPVRHELDAMKPLWARVRCPVILLQGDRDQLVPPANADFAARMLPASILTVRRDPEQNHFIPWTKPDWIRQAVLDLLPPGQAATAPTTSQP